MTVRSTNIRRTGIAAIVVIAFSFASLLLPLPDSAREPSPVQSVRVTDRMGRTLRVLGSDGRHRPVSISTLPPIVTKALVATEDRRFYQHSGLSIPSIIGALVTNVRAGRVVRGGSTLTMQVARALRQKHDRNLIDKLLEMHLALRLDRRLEKQQILELWLNRVSFGNQLFGIEEASSYYFDKPAADLTSAEATLLLGLPQSPSRLNPFRHLDRALQRRQTVVQACVRDSVLTPVEAANILSSRPDFASRGSVPFWAPQFVEYVRENAAEKWEVATEIRTTLDRELQDRVERLAETHLASVNRLGVSNVSAIVLDNATGNVLAYLGSADFWNKENLGQNDGVRALRQPGSALKPFAYAAGLRRGLLGPQTLVADIPLEVPAAGGAFAPQNYDRQFHGPVSVRTALSNSYNVPAVRVAESIGAESILHDLRSVGFTSLDRPARKYGVGIVLGNGEVTLLALARAYSALARGGSLPTLRSINTVVTTAGDTLRWRVPSSQPTVIDEVTSYLITDILSDALAREPAFGRGGPLELPFACATKTGTSKDYRDNFAVGYTPRHTVAVWAGNFDGSPMERVSGISGAGPLMKAIFLELGSGGRFQKPEGIDSEIVCDESGAKPGQYCTNLALRPFRAGYAPRDTCRMHESVTVDARTNRPAVPGTPPEFKKRKTLVRLPAEYEQWANEHGIVQAPPPDASTTYANDNAAVLINVPMDGSIFQIDPVLRKMYQTIRLAAVVDASISDVAWWIDGVKSDLPVDAVRWQLEPGWHRFEVRGFDSAGQSRHAVSRIFVADLPGD